MKYTQWIGIAAAFLLVAASFMPWVYFPGLGKDFTGFYSEGNSYGRPGKFLIFFSAVMTLFFTIPKIWAKRVNIFLAAITIAFAIRSYILYIGCYKGLCPEKRAGIFLVLLASAIMLIAALTPNIPVKQENPED